MGMMGMVGEMMVGEGGGMMGVGQTTRGLRGMNGATGGRVALDGDTTGTRDPSGLHALWTLDQVKLDELTLGKGLEASIIVDGGVMDKDYRGGWETREMSMEGGEDKNENEKRN